MSDLTYHRELEGVHHPVRGLYSQAVEVTAGSRVEFASILPYDEDGDLDDDLVVQTVVMMENVRRALEAVGLDTSDVVRVQVQATDLDALVRTRAIGQIFELFGDDRPAASISQARMVNPDVKIQIDVSAVRGTRL